MTDPKPRPTWEDKVTARPALASLETAWANVQANRDAEKEPKMEPRNRTNPDGFNPRQLEEYKRQVEAGRIASAQLKRIRQLFDAVSATPESYPHALAAVRQIVGSSPTAEPDHIPASDYDCFSGAVHGKNGLAWVAQENPGENEMFIEIQEEGDENTAAVHFTADQLLSLIRLLMKAYATVISYPEDNK